MGSFSRRHDNKNIQWNLFYCHLSNFDVSEMNRVKTATEQSDFLNV